MKQNYTISQKVLRAMCIIALFIPLSTWAQTVLLNQDFTQGKGDFEIKDVNRPAALSAIWEQTSAYGMKATAYSNSTNYASESWVISPLIDLSTYENAKCSFYQALNYFLSIDKAKEEATLWVSTDKTNWTQLKGYTYPTSLSWSFVETGEIDLSAYSGQRIYLGMKYVSTTEKAGTWEIKWFKVTATEADIQTVTSLTALKQLASGSVVKLTLPMSNPAIVSFVNPPAASGTSQNQTAFVSDNATSISLVNFLSNDAGWHTAHQGALIGTVLGKYEVVNNMPQFTSVDASNAEKILCLDNYASVTPKALSVANLLTATYLADFVQLSDIALTKTNGKLYATSGGQQLLVENTFGLSSVSMPINVSGNRYNIAGILTTSDGANCLSVTSIEQAAMLLEMYDEEDNAGNITYFKGEELNVNIVREIPAGSWNTIVLPYSLNDAVDILGDVQLAEFTGVNSQDNTLEFTTVYNIEAGHPYLIKPTENIYAIFAAGVVVSDELTTVTKGDIDMVPIYDAQSLAKNDNTVLFLANDNKLYNPTENVGLCSFRAYFRSANAHDGAQITVDGQPTGIVAVIADVDSNGNYFDVAGRPIAKQPNKGIYVKKGNKLIIK